MIRFLKPTLASLAVMAAACGPVSAADLLNGSFEEALQNWQTQDLSGLPTISIQPAGAPMIFGGAVTPTDGDFTFTTMFDGPGPGLIRLWQDAGVVNPGDTLTFNYRLGWVINPGGAARTFSIEIEPAGGGDPLSVFPVFSADGGTSVTDTGPLILQLQLNKSCDSVPEKHGLQP